MEAVKDENDAQFITMFSVDNLPNVNSLTLKPESLQCLDAHLGMGIVKVLTVLLLLSILLIGPVL